jgi:hypothetical protein
LRVLDVRLHPQHALLAHHAEDVVQQGQQVDVILFAVGRPLHQAGRVAQRRLDDLAGVGREEGADRAAEDDQQFIGLPQRQQLPM